MSFGRIFGQRWRLTSLALFLQGVWAIREDKLREIEAFITIKAQGGELPKYKVMEAPPLRIVTFPNGNKKSRAVAVLPLFGLINQRMNMIMDFSGGTSTEMFTKDFRTLLANPDIGAIVINIDSPGGGVYGTPELAQEIYNSRGKKNIVAVANSVAASGAFWVGSAAEELVVTPGGEVGSIGVYALHREFSQAQAREGVKTTFIKAGRYKTAGNPHEPLSDDARVYLQSNVDRYYEMFTGAVARYRGVKLDQVKNGFGEGGMVGARDALRLRMADRVATLDETIARLIQEHPAPAGLSPRDQQRASVYREAKGLRLSVEDESRRQRLKYL